MTLEQARQAVKDLRKKLAEYLEQEPKIGHWIDIMVGDMPAQVCDQCKTFYPLSYTGGGHNYCPSCGSRMVEPQESEDEG
jgi:PHP family Zn ribbon phosphoesterase